jgi:hypothetical protein
MASIRFSVGRSVSSAWAFSLRLVQASRPIIAHLLLHRGAVGLWLSRDLEHRLMNERRVPQLEFAKSTPVNLVGRDRVVGDPALARVLIEVSAGIHRGVHILCIEMVELRRRLFGSARGRFRRHGLGEPAWDEAHK